MPVIHAGHRPCHWKVQPCMCYVFGISRPRPRLDRALFSLQYTGCSSVLPLFWGRGANVIRAMVYTVSERSLFLLFCTFVARLIDYSMSKKRGAFWDWLEHFAMPHHAVPHPRHACTYTLLCMHVSSLCQLLGPCV